MRNVHNAQTNNEARTPIQEVAHHFLGEPGEKDQEGEDENVEEHLQFPPPTDNIAINLDLLHPTKSGTDTRKHGNTGTAPKQTPHTFQCIRQPEHNWMNRQVQATNTRVTKHTKNSLVQFTRTIDQQEKPQPQSPVSKTKHDTSLLHEHLQHAIKKNRDEKREKRSYTPQTSPSRFQCQHPTVATGTLASL